jgi:hypothetical protein
MVADHLQSLHERGLDQQPGKYWRQIEPCAVQYLYTAKRPTPQAKTFVPSVESPLSKGPCFLYLSKRESGPTIASPISYWQHVARRFVQLMRCRLSTMEEALTPKKRRRAKNLPLGHFAECRCNHAAFQLGGFGWLRPVGFWGAAAAKLPHISALYSGIPLQ